MEDAAATASTGGYRDPPWKFQGSALYQFHLVKSEVARALIPTEFRLVEAFGYTLGGFFLARYEDSPAGVFDELVVIAGLIWNPPSSCAWASRVLVSSNEACLHGRKEVGLPSHVARFSKSRAMVDMMRNKEDSAIGFLKRIGLASDRASPCTRTATATATEVTQLSGPLHDIFSVNLLDAAPQESAKKWMGPSIKMSLPSFSGRTQDNPCLLKYSCKMACRVRLVKPVKVTTSDSGADNEAARERKTDASSLSQMVMLSKPILALEFNRMHMSVEAPLVVAE